MATLEVRMMEGMGALAVDTKERGRQLTARLLADREEREARLSVKLLTMDGIETELTQKGQCEQKQWEDLAGLMRLRQEDTRAVKQAVDNITAERRRRRRVRERQCRSQCQRETPICPVCQPTSRGDRERSTLPGQRTSRQSVQCRGRS